MLASDHGWDICCGCCWRSVLLGSEPSLVERLFGLRLTLRRYRHRGDDAPRGRACARWDGLRDYKVNAAPGPCLPRDADGTLERNVDRRSTSRRREWRELARLPAGAARAVGGHSAPGAGDAWRRRGRGAAGTYRQPVGPRYRADLRAPECGGPPRRERRRPVRSFDVPRCARFFRAFISCISLFRARYSIGQRSAPGYNSTTDCASMLREHASTRHVTRDASDEVESTDPGIDGSGSNPSSQRERKQMGGVQLMGWSFDSAFGLGSWKMPTRASTVR